jgi:uncharacterized damage-inducible protein DinB
MQKISWLDRQLTFGLPIGMLPFYLERMDGTYTRLQSKVKGIDESVLSNKLDDKWSVKQNIGHLAEVDEISLIRIEEMLNGISPMTSAVFENKQDFNAQPIEDVLKFFLKSRQQSQKRLRSLNDVELTRSSVHPRFKSLMTPVDLAWFHAEHDDHHLVRINEILESFSK